MVEGAALEMLCPERDLGFESLTLRQENALLYTNKGAFLFIFRKNFNNKIEKQIYIKQKCCKKQLFILICQKVKKL